MLGFSLSLTYNIKRIEATVVLLECYINNTDLTWLELGVSVNTEYQSNTRVELLTVMTLSCVRQHQSWFKERDRSQEP